MSTQTTTYVKGQFYKLNGYNGIECTMVRKGTAYFKTNIGRRYKLNKKGELIPYNPAN